MVVRALKGIRFMDIRDFTSLMGMIIAQTLTVGIFSSSFHLDQAELN